MEGASSRRGGGVGGAREVGLEREIAEVAARGRDLARPKALRPAIMVGTILTAEAP